MNAILRFQFVAQKELSDQSLKTELDPLLSILDDLTESVCRKHGTATFYRPGQLCDAPHTAACRWSAVIHLSKERCEALLRLLRSLQPLLSTLAPSCTLQWKAEPLDFLAS